MTVVDDQQWMTGDSKIANLQTSQGMLTAGMLHAWMQRRLCGPAAGPHRQLDVLADLWHVIHLVLCNESQRTVLPLCDVRALMVESLIRAEANLKLPTWRCCSVPSSDIVNHHQNMQIKLPALKWPSRAAAAVLEGSPTCIGEVFRCFHFNVHGCSERQWQDCKLLSQTID